jgi:tetratricopeptide (TPR) repeat protein
MDEDKYFQEVSQDEVYRSIDEEINKAKKTHPVAKKIKSEKKGIILPLIVNVTIVVVISLGLLYYFFATRGRDKQESLSSSVAGIEAEVIREIQRRSAEEVELQKRKLEDARRRLKILKEERDFFLQNQGEILRQKEMELDEAYQKSIEEAKSRITASGVSNVTEEFEREKKRLFEELVDSKKRAQLEMEEIKRNYETELSLKEDEIQNEVKTYTFQLNEVEQRLQEEQAKLKEAEEKFKRITLVQQQNQGFQKQLDTVYDKTLKYFSDGDYERGIGELKDEASLRIEENLVKNMLYLAEREQNRVDLDQIGREVYEAAQTLEKEGNLEEALSRYFTVYAIGTDSIYKNRSLSRARAIMDMIYEDRTESGIARVERRADSIFRKAMNYKNNGEYDLAIKSFEEIITKYPESSKRHRAIDELLVISNLITTRETVQEKEDSDRKLNQQALQIMNKAESLYKSGNLSDALDMYEEVVRKYKDSVYAEKALEEIRNINFQMRDVKVTTTVSLDGEGSIIGVVVQVLPGNNVLINLGSVDDIKIGDELQVLRKEVSGFELIGSLKIYSASPKTSKGKIVYSEQDIKIGDIVTF